MNVPKENPLVTAYVLGECDAREAASLEREMSESSEMANEVAEMQKISALLMRSLGSERLTLGAERIAQIKKSAQRPDADVILLSSHRRSRWQTMGVVLATAAVVTLGFFVLNRTSVQDAGIAKNQKSSNVTTPNIAAQSGGAEIVSNQDARSKVPLVVGNSSVAGLEKILVNEGRLPKANEVNLAELVAYPDYQMSPQMQAGEVGVMTELGPCPWRAEAVLVGVWLEAKEARLISLEMTINKKTVKSAKLLGYPENGAGDFLNDQNFQGKQCVLYEMVPHDLGKTEELFSLNLAVANGLGGAVEGFLPNKEMTQNWEDCSVAWRTAAVLAAFEKKLVLSDAESPSLQVLSARAAKISSETDDARARYALDLVALAAEIQPK